MYVGGFLEEKFASGFRNDPTTRVLTSGEVVKQQFSLIGKLEDAIRQHERACVEKQQLEENMKIMEEENKKLKDELDSLKQNKTTEPDTAMNEKIASTKSRISACVNEMTDLQQRIQELKSIIEEQGMQIKREVETGVVNILGHVSMMVQQESEKKEADYLATLKQKEEDLLAAQEQRSSEALKEKDAQLQLYENALQEKEKALLMALEEGKEKEQRSSEALKEKDAQLQLLQTRGDEFHRRILELELLCDKALQEKEKVQLMAQKEGKEKEQRSLEALKEKDTKLLQKQKTEDKLHIIIEKLESINADLKKKLRIKESELQNLKKSIGLKLPMELAMHPKNWCPQPNRDTCN